jgi:hypothetical protein
MTLFQLHISESMVVNNSEGRTSSLGETQRLRMGKGLAVIWSNVTIFRPMLWVLKACSTPRDSYSRRKMAAASSSEMLVNFSNITRVRNQKLMTWNFTAENTPILTQKIFHCEVIMRVNTIRQWGTTHKWMSLKAHFQFFSTQMWALYTKYINSQYISIQKFLDDLCGIISEWGTFGSRNRNVAVLDTPITEELPPWSQRR